MKITFDLHFHANTYCLMHLLKKQRLKQYRNFLEKINLDYLASTEHIYKKPLDTFKYLRESARDLPTEILPGVEWISKEGIDIIFLFDSENSLDYALNYLKSFKKSVWELNNLSQDTNAITIVPHPFGPGKTSLAKNLGVDNYLSLSKYADLVEIQNGAVIPYLHLLLSSNRINKIPARFLKEILFTYNLPFEFRPQGAGWAIGSDAHLPATQNVFGVAEVEDMKSFDWFNYLKTQGRLQSLYFEDINKLHLQRFMRASFHDYLFKKYKLLRKKCSKTVPGNPLNIETLIN